MLYSASFQDIGRRKFTKHVQPLHLQILNLRQSIKLDVRRDGVLRWPGFAARVLTGLAVRQKTVQPQKNRVQREGKKVQRGKVTLEGARLFHKSF